MANFVRPFEKELPPWDWVEIFDLYHIKRVYLIWIYQNKCSFSFFIFFIYLKPWTDLHQCLRMTGDLVVATAWRLLTQWRNYSGSFVCYWKIERKAFSIQGRLCKKLPQHFGQLCLCYISNSKLSKLIVDLCSMIFNAVVVIALV